MRAPGQRLALKRPGTLCSRAWRRHFAQALTLSADDERDIQTGTNPLQDSKARRCADDDTRCDYHDTEAVFLPPGEAGPGKWARATGTECWRQRPGTQTGTDTQEISDSGRLVVETCFNLQEAGADDDASSPVLSDTPSLRAVQSLGTMRACHLGRHCRIAVAAAAPVCCQRVYASTGAAAQQHNEDVCVLCWSERQFPDRPRASQGTAGQVRRSRRRGRRDHGKGSRSYLTEHGRPACVCVARVRLLLKLTPPAGLEGAPRVEDAQRRLRVCVCVRTRVCQRRLEPGGCPRAHAICISRGCPARLMLSTYFISMYSSLRHIFPCNLDACRSPSSI